MSSPSLSDEPPLPGLCSSRYAASSRLRREALKFSTLEGLFSTVHVTLTGGTFITGYAVMLGASDFHLGLMNSFPHFLQVFQILAAYVTWRVGSRRTVCAAGVWIWRGIALLLAFLPFLPGLSVHQRVLAFLFLLLVSNVAAMFTVNAWSVWMADLVPKQVRGRYFGFRSMLALIIAITVAWGGAALLDACKKGDSVGEKTGFLLIFGVAAAAAIAGAGFLRRQWEPPMRTENPPTVRQLFSILRNREFRRLCAFFFVWNFGIGLSASFFAKHMLHHLHMDYRTMTVYSVIVSVAGFLSARPIGRLIDLWGTRPTLAVCAGVVAVLPLMWLPARPGFLLPLWIDGVLTGVFWTGFQLAAFNLPWIVTPEKNRAYYLGVFTTIAGLGIGLSALLSGHLAQVLAHVKMTVPGLSQPLINYHLIFVMSTLVRLASLPLVPREPGKQLFPFLRRLRRSRLMASPSPGASC